MEIKSVTFTKNENWNTTNPGRWVGRVQFNSNNGNCEIPLSPEVSEKLLTALTPVIVEFSQRATCEIAAILTKQMGDKTTPAIEA